MSSIPERDYEAFYLSLWSNLLSTEDIRGTKPELERKLFKEITDNMVVKRPHWDNQWEIVWGPAVFVKHQIAANAIYMARQLETSRYVVAIAGTNPNSIYDYLIEDASVCHQFPWAWIIRQEVSPALKIAKGSALALYTLLNLKPSDNLPGANQFLFELLKDLPKSQGIDLCFAGHSLGGMMAPAMALYYLDKRASWDPTNQAKISTRPTAGPTAGNKNFAAYSDQKLTDITRYWNNLDPVPRLWVPEAMEQIKTLYNPLIPPNWKIDVVVDTLKFLCRPGHYCQIQPSAESFPSEIQTGDQYKQFFAQVGYQHLQAYMDYFEYGPTDRPQLDYGAMMEKSLAAAFRGKFQPDTQQLSPELENASSSPVFIKIPIGDQEFKLPADLDEQQKPENDPTQNIMDEQLKQEFEKINAAFHQ